MHHLLELKPLGLEKYDFDFRTIGNIEIEFLKFHFSKKLKHYFAGIGWIGGQHKVKINFIKTQFLVEISVEKEAEIHFNRLISVFLQIFLFSHLILLVRSLFFWLDSMLGIFYPNWKYNFGIFWQKQKYIFIDSFLIYISNKNVF